jgi:hypothetical protein
MASSGTTEKKIDREDEPDPNVSLHARINDFLLILV